MNVDNTQFNSNGHLSPPSGGMPSSTTNGNPGGVPPPLATPPEAAAQQFCLRWNSYPATVATQLAALRAQEEFVDVTLACEGKLLKAHKLVLSACSPYFMQLLKSTPSSQYPVIFLRDVGFRQLVALLDFMYDGEVNVSQTELPALLRTAEALQVRGLADTTTANNNNSSSNYPTPSPQPPQQKAGFGTQYGQMTGQTVMNNNTLPNSAQLPLHDVGTPCTSTEVPSQQITSMAPIMGTTSMVSNSITTATCSTSSMLPMPFPVKRDRSTPMSEDLMNKDKEQEEEDFELIGIGDVDQGNLNDEDTGDDLEDTGQVFPSDGAMAFEHLNMGNDNGEHQSEDEETSEEMSEEDAEFAYQSDNSYGQQVEGMAMGENEATPNGDGSAGPSSHPPGAGDGNGPLPIAGKKENMGQMLPIPGTGRNRLNRQQLWPPGIPYHGPQQCPYCSRILSNVGNWRKHVVTMHFAREKNYKCRHCVSAFRTAEYLQKHYVRVHNYPQKMTRRKYSEPT